MNFTLWFWIVNIGTALVRMLVMGRIGLSGDEAHYWAYSRHPALSYFDHPPLIGYLIKLSTSVFGASEFGVRVPALVLFFLLAWVLFLIVKDMYGEKTAFWAVVMLNLVPVFSFLGAVMTIPDSPLAFLWMLFIYYFRKLLKEGSPKYWYLLGIILGLAMLSKYNAVLLAASVLIFLLFSAEHRGWLARKEPYLALLVSFVVFLPVVFWNLENSFASFGFQLRHGFGKAAPHFSLQLLGKCLGAQAGYISPVIFVVFWAVLAALIVRFVKDRKDGDSLLFISFALPSLLLFNAIASFNEILPHWPAMGYMVLVIPVAYYSVKLWDRPWFRAVSIAGWALGLFITLLIPVQAMFKVLKPEWFIPKADAAKMEDGILYAEKVDITNDLYGWREVGQKIDELIRNSPEPKPFVFTHRHYIASQLSFYVPGHPEIYCLSDRVDAYDFWQRDLSKLAGRDGIFVCNEFFYTEPEGIYPFRSWRTVKPVEYYRNGRKVRVFYLTLGRHFDPSKLQAAYTSDLAGPHMTLMQGVRKLDYRLFWIGNRDMSNKVLDVLFGKWSHFDAKINLNTGMVVMIIAVGVYLWKTRRRTFWKEFLIFLGILLAGGIIVNLMKNFLGRARPLTLNGDMVRSFGEHLYGSSFPSGHSQTVFAVAVYLAYKTRKLWWSVLFFAGAAFVAFSRIYVGVHFPADVLVGSLIGGLSAWAILVLTKTDKT